MSSLRSLVADHSDLIMDIIENEGELDEASEKALLDITGDIENKVDGYAVLVERIELEEKYFKAKSDEVLIIAKRLSNLKNNLKDNVKSAMLDMDVKKLVGDNMAFTLVRGKPSVEVDEERLPAKYLSETITYRADKKLIGDELKEGKEIDGARLIESYSLRKKVTSKALEARNGK